MYTISMDELYHWGIKGMHWGERRWQNEDGSLTEAGRKRYGTRENYEKVRDAQRKLRTDKDLAKVKAKQDKLDRKKSEAKQRADAREAARAQTAKMQEEKEAKRDASKEDLDYIKAIRKKKTKDLTSQELADLKQRLSEERQVNSARIDAMTGTDDFMNKMKKQAIDAVTGIAKEKLKSEVEKRLKSYLGIKPSELEALTSEAKLWKERENISNSKKNIVSNTRQEENLKKLLEAERNGAPFTEDKKQKKNKDNSNGNGQSYPQQQKVEKPKAVDSNRDTPKVEAAKAETPKTEAPKAEEKKDYTGPKATPERAVQLNPMASYMMERAKQQESHNQRVLEYEGLNWLSKQNAVKASTYGNVSKEEVEEILKRRRSLNHDDISDVNDFLIHHGIKGQKWGVRRFQDYDGHRIAGKTISKEDYKNIDHQKSDKTELYKFLAYVALDVATMNPVGLAQDVIRLGQAFASQHATEKYNSERIGNGIDTKTGLPKKTKEMSELEDLKRVNPSVHNFDGNTKNNCMLCTTAYDMRRRGFDVQANVASTGYFSEDVTKWYPKAKLESITGYNDKGKPSIKHSTDLFISNALKQGEGARGNIMVDWAGLYGGGHSMIYEVSGGQVRILDAQVNKVYNDPYKILKKCKPKLEYARLDNVKFDPKAIKEACR